MEKIKNLLYRLPLQIVVIVGTSLFTSIIFWGIWGAGGHSVLLGAVCVLLTYASVFFAAAYYALLWYNLEVKEKISHLSEKKEIQEVPFMLFCLCIFALVISSFFVILKILPVHSVLIGELVFGVLLSLIFCAGLFFGKMTGIHFTKK